MRLVTAIIDGFERPAAVVDTATGERLLPLTPTVCGHGVSVVDILASASLRATVASAIDKCLSEGSSPALIAGDGIELLAPVRPGKIICIGYNYRGHVPVGADAAADDPEYPDVFVKTPNALGAPGTPVVIPPASLDVDYEGEIAVVIGTRANNVSEAEALDYVAGYTLFNDVSDRQWQARSSQWELGKCFDGFGPLGPAITTADSITDPHALTMEVERDGVTTVSQSTSTMIFSMAYLVHYISTAMTLEPGDIISTGSPQKLPEALAEHQALAAGDAVTVRVHGLGELTTTFVAPDEYPPLTTFDLHAAGAAL